MMMLYANRCLRIIDRTMEGLLVGPTTYYVNEESFVKGTELGPLPTSRAVQKV